MGDIKSMIPEQKNKSYSPETTAAVRSDVIGQIVSLQADMLIKSPIRTDLNDLEAVREITQRFMIKCAENGCLPNVESLSAALGISRRMFYKFLETHPESPTASYLDQVRTSWAGCRLMAADRKAVDPTISIFLLLNSSLGFSNQTKVEFTTPATPLDGFSQEQIEAARQRYLSSIPDEEE